jgi:hypothetical protein
MLKFPGSRKKNYCGSRILGVKKVPDPGSGSATLRTIASKVNSKKRFHLVDELNFLGGCTEDTLAIVVISDGGYNHQTAPIHQLTAAPLCRQIIQIINLLYLEPVFQCDHIK